MIGRCPVCETLTHLTKHHVVPKAQKRTKAWRNAKRAGRLILLVCHLCHTRIHQRWGTGDRFQGPSTPEATVRLAKRLGNL